MSQFRKASLLLLKHWIDFVQKFRILVIILAVVAGAMALVYTKNNLGMNTDTKDMLSAELNWRKLDLEYEANFPQYTDNILVAVEAGTPDPALDAADLMRGPQRIHGAQ